MQQIVAADIGGTHARFALATIDHGVVKELGACVTLKTSDFVSFERAWNAFEERIGSKLPSYLSLAVAAPVTNEEFSLTNSHWQIRRSQVVSQLELNSMVVINDFAAVAHAISVVDDEDLRHITGPKEQLPTSGVITIVGPGTGLGAAILVRDGNHLDRVIDTEGGHIDFAPLDSLEDRIVEQLRKKFGRVSVERLVSGPGLLNIYEVLRKLENEADVVRDEASLWSSALDETDQIAAIALDRFCLSLGAIAGDLALAHGASAVVIAGGIGKRLGDRLASSGFASRFVAKGRFERRLAAIPVKLMAYPEPGLLGAAVAYAREEPGRST